MQLLIVLCVVCVTAAAPHFQNNAFTLHYDNDYGRGNYKFGYEQSDGQKHEQQGKLKNEGREDESLVVKGKFSWVAPNNIRYTVTYIADENGYQPVIEIGPDDFLTSYPEGGGGFGGGYSPDLVATLLGG